MDLLLRQLIKIQSDVADVLIQIETVILSGNDAQVCQQLLEGSDITDILWKIKDILLACERKDSIFKEQAYRGSDSSYKESGAPEYIAVSADETVPVAGYDDNHQMVTATVKEEGVDLKSCNNIESEVHFTVKIPSKSKRKTSPSRRVTRRAAKNKTEGDITNDATVEEDPALVETSPLDVKNESVECSSVDEGTTNLKNEIPLDGAEKEKQLKDEIVARWKQKIKEGTRKEDIECSVCGKSGFKSLCYFERHELSHQDNKPFACQLCNRTFKYKRCVDQHMTVVHSEGCNYECPQCKQTFKQECNLKTHMLTHAKKQHTCHKCDRSFTLATQLRSHIKTNHEGIFPHWCDVCKKGFKKKAQFEPHMRKHSGEKPFVCDVCNKSFTCKLALNKHQELHEEEIKYTCPTCGRTFKRTDSFKAHMTRHTKSKSEKCQVCGKLFYTKSNLKEHMLKHNRIKTHQCSLCGNLFATKSQLVAHTYRHTDLRPFSCEICNQKFRTKSNMQKHTFRKHRSEADRPFKCEYCAKGLATSMELIHHIRSVHTHDRPYKCDICSTGFVAKKHLRDHKRIHTGEKPYKCSVCNKAFTQSGSLFKHKAVHEKQACKLSLLKTSNEAKMEAFPAVESSNGSRSKPPGGALLERVIQIKTPDGNDAVLDTDLSIVSESNATLYDLIAQTAQHASQEKIAVSVHTTEQGEQLANIVTSIATHNNELAHQSNPQSILVQDPQNIQVLPSDFQQLSYY